MSRLLIGTIGLMVFALPADGEQVPQAAPAENAPSLPDAAAIEVSTVRIAATRPNGSKWNTIAGANLDSCALFDAGKTYYGEAGSTLCRFLSGQKQKRIKRDPSAPDIFVRIKTGDRVYRTPTASHSTQHDFESRFVIPLDAVPTALRFQVIDDDGKGSYSGEQIGEILVTRSRLIEALQQSQPVVLIEKDASVERIVVTISKPPQKLFFLQDANCSTKDHRNSYVRGTQVLGGVEIMRDDVFCSLLKVAIREELQRKGYFVLSAASPQAYIGKITCQREVTGKGSKFASELTLTGPSGARIAVTAQSGEPSDDATFVTVAPELLVRRLAQQVGRP